MTMESERKQGAIMSYSIEEILDCAQRNRHRELRRLLSVAARALARGADRLLRSATGQASRNPSFAAAYTASVRLRASRARRTDDR